MIPTDPATRAAWATYEARNRRANAEYYATTTRVTCRCGRETQSRWGVCLDCRTKDRP